MGRIISVLAAAILCWCWSCRAEAALLADDELREARCALSRVALHRWREPLRPAQGALLTSADAEEDAVFGSVTVVLQLSLFSPLSLSKFRKDPLVFYKKSKISFFLIP